MTKQTIGNLTVSLGILFATQAISARAEEMALVKSEFIFESAAFKSCHASTLAATPAGELVAAWFGGTAEGNPDVGIWFSRQVEGKWSAPVEVANGIQYGKTDGSVRRHPCWNPVLFQPKHGPLLLFYKVGPKPHSWWGMLITSEDGGLTWSPPHRLPEHLDGPVKNKPVELANGDLLCPSSTEHDGWRVHFERTSDLGRTWVRTEPLNDGLEIAAIQPSILCLGGEKLLAVGRTRQNRMFEIGSPDGGYTWGKMTLGNLPNPNSGTDAVTAHNGRHYLVYNHVPGLPGLWGGKRTPLNLAVSSDAQTWQAALVLESDPGEYSYPAIIQSADQLLHITYTWKRQRVKHVIIDPLKLQPRDYVNGAWPP